MRPIILLIVSLAWQVAAIEHHQFIEAIAGENGIDYKMSIMLPEIFQQQEEESCTATVGAFTPYDYSIVIGMLVISLGIGVFYGFFDKKEGATSGDFMLGTDMSVIPVTLSLATSFITAIELLGNPAEVYFNGLQFSLIVVSMLLVIPLATYVFYPIYDNMQLTSCYEYLGMRFGKELRIFGGILYILQMCFYTSVSVLAPAIALSKATGLNTRLAIVLIYIVCVFYSSQGGLKAVVIADTFQTCVLFVSLILVVVLGTYLQEGGISEILTIGKQRGRMEILDFDPNPTTRHTVFSVIIGGFFYWASLLCVNQSSVQKAMSLRNLTKARIALTLSVFLLVAVFLINFYTGLMVFAKYEACDPLAAGKINGIDQLMPYYVMETFSNYTTFVGIFVAGIFAASLGTVAACLSSLSAVTMEDLLVSGMNIKFSPEMSTRYAKWMNVGYGVISFGLIFLVEGRGILQATLTLNGLIGGVLFGLFCLGIFVEKANLKGALYGGILSTLCVLVLGVFALTYGEDENFLETSTEGCSCVVNSTIAIEANEIINESWYTSIYKVSYLYYGMIGCFLTVFFGFIVSVLTSLFDEKRIQKILASERNQEQSNSSVQTPNVFVIPHNCNNDNAQDNISISNDETIQVGEEIRFGGASVIGIFGKRGIDNLGMTIDDESLKK